MAEFESERHALYCGWVLGLAMRYGIPARPVVTAEGEYTNRLTCEVEGGATVTLVVPPPPDDWTFDLNGPPPEHVFELADDG